MSKKDKMQMPQSTAGLVRYFDESKESIKMKPEHVVVICVVLIAIELAFKFGLLGI
jgi:preprotein translocase subunit Sec61beta